VAWPSCPAEAGAPVGSATGGQPGDLGGPSARADSQVPDLAFALASLFAEPNGSPSPLVVQNLEEWAAARPDYKAAHGRAGRFCRRCGSGNPLATGVRG